MSSTGQGSRNAVRQVNGAERQVTRILADLERQKRSAETEIKRLHKSVSLSAFFLCRVEGVGDVGNGF